MTALLLLSCGLNVVLAVAMVAQSVRAVRAADRACASCPFVLGPAEAGLRASLPVLK